MAGYGPLSSNPIAYGRVVLSGLERRGSILLPCLLLLSLISLTALGFLGLTGTEIKISSAMDDNHLAKLAAYSGREVALLRLKSDVSYAGDGGMVFPDGDGSVNITMATPAPFERTITSIGYCGSSQSQIQLTAEVYPRHFSFALTLAADLAMNRDSKLLGDLYVTGNIKGETTALITGNVYLYGTRSILTDINGKVVSIDGQVVPTINGEAFDNQKSLSTAGWSLAALKTIAESQGQYYTKNQSFKDQEFKGVVYVSSGKDVEFSNVIIRGIFVSEPPSGWSETITSGGKAANSLIVKGGYFLKIISDPSVQEDVALIAPASNLRVETNAYMDALGSVVIGYGEIAPQSEGTITGTTLVGGGMECSGDFVFQSPRTTRDSDPSAVLFKEYTVTETEYSEQ